MEIFLRKTANSQIDDNYGSLTQGKVVDIVLLDENLEIKHIIKDGKILDNHVVRVEN